MELVINDRIRNRSISLFNKVRINLKFDSVASTFSFEYYFNPNNNEHKELSCIGHYHICKITHNGETLLTGYVLSIAFNGGAVRQMVSIGGYSLPGVLEDCDIPIAIEGMSLQNTDKSLKDIALRYIKPFGLGLIIDESVVIAANNSISDETPIQTNTESLPVTVAAPGVADLIYLSQNVTNQDTQEGSVDKWQVKITPWGNDDDSVMQKMNAQIETSTAKINDNIKGYLSRLASYKNIILSHDGNGNLVFTKAKRNLKPVANYHQGVAGTSMSLSFNGQQMHSHITCVQQTDSQTDTVDAPTTIRNPFVPYVFRPKTIVVSNPPDGNDYTLTAAKNALCDELRGLKLIITVDRWTFPNGKIIKPNNCINVINEEIYLYKTSRWYIEEVSLEGNEVEQIAKLTCVLPSVYDYTQPVYLFEGINLHKH
jgi:prophage tail gpP-like protein